MRNTIIVICMTFTLINCKILSQSESKPVIDFHGFVKTDIFYDTRQTSSIREGHFLLLPLNENLDHDNNDINAADNFNILSVQTRLNGKINGPEVNSIKTSGFIEGEFFGTCDTDINSFRLRHAYVDLDWENSQLRVGQFWHPMFITECFPNVVSFNTGAPFQPFSRNPQIRLTYKMDGFEVITTALSQRDFQNFGPSWNRTEGKYDAVQSSNYSRYSTIPEINLLFKYKSDKFLIGSSGGYKILRPQLTTDIKDADNKVFSNDNKIGSYAAMVFLKILLKPLTLKFEAVMGQNLTNMTMIGGYAVKSYDSITGIMDYTNNNILSAWTDIEFALKENLSINLFGGYTKNLGFDDNIIKVQNSCPAFARSADVDQVFRLSPYVRWNIGKVQIAFEIEYTSAAYGKINLNDKGKVEQTKDIANIRALTAVYINF